ncbi:hypothetical protein WJ542_30050 [Paraburkholderia sp. B3]|uniref:hypothetical protein n=1 Tax=Paraburkholderia sp. B3 TaxID=3134791 RepID=UPI003981A17C
MSDNHIYFVDPAISLNAAPGEAQRMTTWLQARGIIGPATRIGDLYVQWMLARGLKEDGELTEINEIGFPPGTNYSSACDAGAHLPPAIPNWLKINLRGVAK